jgi:hypothetical protein
MKAGADAVVQGALLLGEAGLGKEKPSAVANCSGSWTASSVSPRGWRVQAGPERGTGGLTGWGVLVNPSGYWIVGCVRAP